eukprot:TRINITY_DN74249_c0_g1_i1.p1 TRINITY_DN74249_c0_g1~~TRINITY_DN74249_c0_g1_i1.p1  ORF type:complete len:369 (-),score=45.89 TRINITY_DN74249_c0_g1_i1:105-1118(-)
MAAVAWGLLTVANGVFVLGEEDIFTWSKRNEVDVSAIDITSFPRKGGAEQVRGLAAARHIEEGDIILHIPEKLWLSTGRAPAVEACVDLWASWSGYLHEELLLTLLLERTLGEESTWYEYIQTLPTLAEFAEFYPYASEQMSREFEALPVIDAHESWRTSLTELRDWVVEHRAEGCFEGGTPSADDFLWADCVISSRSFGRELHDGTRAKVLIPVSDLGNAPESPRGIDPTLSYANTEWDHNEGASQIIALRPIARGEELTLPYGEANLGSPEFILDTWGFIQESSLDDVTILPSESCVLLEPAINKYIVEGKCTASAVACNLARLAKLACPAEEVV